MKGVMKTKVAQNAIGHELDCIEKIIDEPDGYVLKVGVDSAKYICKGYLIKLEPFSKERAEQAFKKLQFIYQEYFFSKFGSELNSHVVKALGIDWISETAHDEKPDLVCFEILFEYGGVSLEDSIDNSKKKVPLLQIYDWMRQSAPPLAMLHNLGISHMDIKPANLVYDKATGILKVIDMGSSTGFSSKSKMYKSTVTLAMREFTEIYCPPEVLRVSRRIDSIAGGFITGAIDVYCWAMCFYHIITKKSFKDLDDDIEMYKIGPEKVYQPFLARVNKELDAYPLASSTEKRLQEFIKTTLNQALQYNPKNRVLLTKIADNMVGTEAKESMLFPYESMEEKKKEEITNRLLLISKKSQMEMKHIEETIKIKQKELEELKLKEKTLILDIAKLSKDKILAEEHFKAVLTSVINFPEEKKTIEAEAEKGYCQDCLKNVNCRVYLSCGHKICLKCACHAQNSNLWKKNQETAKICCPTCKKKDQTIGISFLM